MPDGVALDNVLLVVDELVTNAVQAGASAVEVDLAAVPRRLDLVVTDDAGGWPTPRAATDEDVSGRGLAIVGLLSDRWTVAALQLGKSVTATWFGSGHPLKRD
jgi:two-component sensor histidine kinase